MKHETSFPFCGTDVARPRACSSPAIEPNTRIKIWFSFEHSAWLCALRAAWHGVRNLPYFAQWFERRRVRGAVESNTSTRAESRVLQATWHGVRNIPFFAQWYQRQRVRGLTVRALALRGSCVCFVCGVLAPGMLSVCVCARARSRRHTIKMLALCEYRCFPCWPCVSIVGLLVGIA